MAINVNTNNSNFGVGDVVRVTQSIEEGDKKRNYAFEGMVMGIKGRGDGRTFTVRRIGEAQIGIERIFPVASPSIKSIEIVKDGQRGVRRAKLFYTRDKSKREIDEIYRRATRKIQSKKNSKVVKKAKVSKSSTKKTTSKSKKAK